MRTFSLTSFINLLPKRSIEFIFRKCGLFLTGSIFSFLFCAVVPVSAQDILFDFNSAPLHSSLPLYQTSGGITAHLSATGSGYSIQEVNVMGFTPPGFTGYMLYPNSINASDIRIQFDHALTDFSIMYACQELGCDDAATMRVTAYLAGAYIGYANRTATFPGTWPVDTLRCHFAQGFDSVIIHYQSPPPTCQDYGTIYIADNMRVTASPVGISAENGQPENFMLYQNYPNPFNPTTDISFSLPKDGYVLLKVYDALGQEVQSLVNEQKKAGNYKETWDASGFSSGIYFYSITAGDFRSIRKMVLIK
jgi:hypothetical protein